MSKIGLGIVTCNRNNFLKTCLKSINKEWYDELVIVNDGEIPLQNAGYNIINNEKNIGVCKSKNKLFRHLLETGCDYIFIIEDDMMFKDNVFQAYINA